MGLEGISGLMTAVGIAGGKAGPEEMTDDVAMLDPGRGIFSGTGGAVMVSVKGFSDAPKLFQWLSYMV